MYPSPLICPPAEAHARPLSLLAVDSGWAEHAAGTFWSVGPHTTLSPTFPRGPRPDDYTARPSVTPLHTLQPEDEWGNHPANTIDRRMPPIVEVEDAPPVFERAATPHQRAIVDAPEEALLPLPPSPPPPSPPPLERRRSSSSSRGGHTQLPSPPLPPPPSLSPPPPPPPPLPPPPPFPPPPPAPRRAALPPPLSSSLPPTTANDAHAATAAAEPVSPTLLGALHALNIAMSAAVGAAVVVGVAGVVAAVQS